VGDFSTVEPGFSYYNRQPREEVKHLPPSRTREKGLSEPGRKRETVFSDFL
jgi:hypothetical protein